MWIIRPYLIYTQIEGQHRLRINDKMVLLSLLFESNQEILFDEPKSMHAAWLSVLASESLERDILKAYYTIQFCSDNHNYKQNQCGYHLVWSRGLKSFKIQIPNGYGKSFTCLWCKKLNENSLLSCDKVKIRNEGTK